MSSALFAFDTLVDDKLISGTTLHGKAAKKVFDSYPDKFPSIAELNTEERQLILQRQKDYAEYKEAKASSRELATVKANIHSVLRDDEQRTDKSRTTQTR